MKIGLFIGCLLILVPLQAIGLGSVSPFGIRPDLCLIASCLAGFLTGQVQGFLLGLFLGFIQDLFSASDLWLNTIIKAGMGFFAGLIARNFATIASHAVFLLVAGFSFFSGVGFWVFSRAGMDVDEILQVLLSILLPQALFDGVVALGVHWAIMRWMPDP